MCPEPSAGETFTLVSTTGSLSGTFGNAAEGDEIGVKFRECLETWSLRISYQRSGPVQSVIGTVEPGAPELPAAPLSPVTPVKIETPPLHLLPYGKASSTPPAKPAAAEPAPSRATLLARTLAVRDGRAAAKLRCSGGTGCDGTLLLTVEMRSKSWRQARAVSIGSAHFSLVAGKTRTVEIDLDRAGRRLLRAHQDKLTCTLAIASSGASQSTSSLAKDVRLVG